MIDYETLRRCFTGVVPSMIATCSADGTPNVTFLSQMHYVDEHRVAVSCQFFNKTRRNIAENPHACVFTCDPLTLEAYELHLRFHHSETSGPLFDSMSVRIQAIASHTGMKGVFKLVSADVYDVLEVRKVAGFLDTAQSEEALPPPRPPSFRSELSVLQAMSERLRSAKDLDDLLSTLLAALRSELGFEHSMVLLLDEHKDRLYAVASSGYGDSGTGAGAEVALGEGYIGAVAEHRRTLRVSAIDEQMRYGRSIRREARTRNPGEALRPEIPLPGLPDARSQLAIPLVARDCLVGVLAIESLSSLAFDDWHEAFLDIIGNQVAVAIENVTLREDADEAPPQPAAEARKHLRTRTFSFFKNDDCVFVDGEYLIRNVPGRILWKILRAFAASGRTDFNNRELRLDPSLGLPAVKDNLESRLILLRKRLEQKCTDVRLAPTSRGHFRLHADCAIELVERESG